MDTICSNRRFLRAALLLTCILLVSFSAAQISTSSKKGRGASDQHSAQAVESGQTFQCGNPRQQSQIDPASKHSVVLSWKASVSLSNPLANGEGYNLYRLNPDGSCTKMNATLIQGTSYQDHFVELGKTYHYTTKAVNRKGESGPSNVVEVSIPRT
jgi:hypothetical protein